MSYWPALTPALSPRRGCAVKPLGKRRSAAAFVALPDAENHLALHEIVVALPLPGEREGVRAVVTTFQFKPLDTL
jgi:hypothetical protein